MGDGPDAGGDGKMTPVAETDGGAKAETRRGRHHSPPLAIVTAEPVVRPGVVEATLAGAGLLSIAGYAGRTYVVLVVVFAGFILAWGWAELVGSTNPRGSAVVLGFGALGLAASVMVVDDSPALRLMPVALAACFVAIFVMQLVRTDDRAHLTRCVAGDALGVTLIASAMSLAPLADLRRFDLPVGMTAAALAIGALPDLLLNFPRVRRWLLPLAMGLGAVAAVAVGWFGAPGTPLGVAALIGVLAAGCSHAMRRVLAALLTSDSPRAALTIGVAGLAIPGFAVYTVGTLLLG